jgi:hypothetical protein
VGAWAYVRDLLEATSQRWDRHVVNYDLQQQVGIWQRISDRYRRSAPKLPTDWSGPRLAVISGSAIVLGGLLAWWLARRRARRQLGGGPSASAKSPSAVVAIALYESLEGAMGAQGVPRSPSTPPLRHAETLSSVEHPLAGEILLLTDIYLRARFGGEAIDEELRRSYEARVKALRAADLKALREPPPPDPPPKKRRKPKRDQPAAPPP